MHARLSVTPHAVVLGHDGLPRYAGFCPRCRREGNDRVVTAHGEALLAVCHYCGTELQFRVSGVHKKGPAGPVGA
jgi:NMD protein affecting ribosome stability and mRNA decay